RPPGPKPGALAKLSHTPYFSVASLLSYPRRKNYYMAIHAFCQQLFKTFFKNFSNARKPFIFAASQAFHTLEYPDIFKKIF
ncbi:hypothetical protein, partial [Eubacterium ramulus]|uniref:hypothetical protein n=1 Tax=Eubacterium ramulus TaxID=39490 RepID=UPI0026EEE6FC